MLRGIFVLAVIAFGAVNVVRGPFYTLLLYLGLAYFRPETWLWDPSLYLALDLSWITGIVLLVSTLVRRVRWRFDTRTGLLLLFVIQDTCSTFLSNYFDFSLFYWRDFVRCAVISYLISVLVDDRRKLRLALVVIAFSLSLEAAKQGWAGLVLDPGAKNLNSVTVLGDENETAVGLMMLVPILGSLAATASGRWERYLERFLTLGVIYRAVVTYSRGGFLTALALAGVYFVRSKRKLHAILVIGVLAAVISPILPSQFWSRMSTITANADQRNDLSEGRLYFWGVALRMAADHPVFGVGHNAFIPAYNHYDSSLGQFGVSRAVHSTWFGVLADLGYPGLLLFLANIFFAFLACGRVRKMAKGRSDLADLRAFAVAMETALVAFTVGGTFISYHYSEFVWHTVGLAAAMNAIAVGVKVPARAIEQVPSPSVGMVRLRRLAPPRLS